MPPDTALSTVVPIAAMQLEETMEAVEPGQDFDWGDFIPSNPLGPGAILQDLSEMGTSIQLGEGDGMYRMQYPCSH